ncbi:MAG: hypothetical protein WBD36_05880 [Bacteroidota bacterium]
MNIFQSHHLYLKDQAALLLKHAQESGPYQKDAIARFNRLESFSSLSPGDAKALASLQLKHALSVVAVENGYESWAELKGDLDKFAEGSRLAEIRDQFYPPRSEVFSNNWFPNYQKAKAVHAVSRGFLLPYRHHFFICETGFVSNLGLSPSLPEWEAIGYDWVHPNHVKSWLRLNEIFADVLKSKEENRTTSS